LVTPSYKLRFYVSKAELILNSFILNT